jgi:hypothetical protein
VKLNMLALRPPRAAGGTTINASCLYRVVKFSVGPAIPPHNRAPAISRAAPVRPSRCSLVPRCFRHTNKTINLLLQKKLRFLLFNSQMKNFDVNNFYLTLPGASENFVC